MKIISLLLAYAAGYVMALWGDVLPFGGLKILSVFFASALFYAAVVLLEREAAAKRATKAPLPRGQ